MPGRFAGPSLFEIPGLRPYVSAGSDAYRAWKEIDSYPATTTGVLNLPSRKMFQWAMTEAGKAKAKPIPTPAFLNRGGLWRNSICRQFKLWAPHQTIFCRIA